MAVVLFLASALVGVLIYLLSKENRGGGRKRPAKNKNTGIKKSKKSEQSAGWKLPKELPRNMGTVKIIAQERIDLAVKVVKLWLREAVEHKKS